MYTINNYDDEIVQRMKDLDCVYHCFGKEIGEEKGTPHLQGCITFAKSARFTTVRRYIPGNLVRPCVIEQARNYCLKDGDTFIKDNRQQGARTDLNEFAEYLKTGANLKAGIWKFPMVYMKYPQGSKDIHDLAGNIALRDFKPVVSWYYGATGLGKSHGVFTSEPSLWVSSNDSKYFNGYRNQEAAVFDDFRGSFCYYSYLLKLLDKWPMTINVKNGYKEWNSRRIYITSSKSPWVAYKREDDNVDQLIRRIDNIIEFLPWEGTTFNDETDLKIHKGVYAPGPNLDPHVIPELQNRALPAQTPGPYDLVAPPDVCDKV